jgi:prefoldin beta subunit
MISSITRAIKRRIKIMTDVEMSKQLQDQINRLQQTRMQLQMIMQQRQQIEIRLKEIDEALEEIKKTDDKTPIYKSVGALLIKTKGKTEVTKELKENKESLELRKTTLDKQEGRTKEKLNELQSKVQNAISASNESEGS